LQLPPPPTFLTHDAAGVISVKITTNYEAAAGDVVAMAFGVYTQQLIALFKTSRDWLLVSYKQYVDIVIHQQTGKQTRPSQVSTHFSQFAFLVFTNNSLQYDVRMIY